MMNPSTYKRAIIIDSNKGIFLGTYSPEAVGLEFSEMIEIMEKDGASLFALFSKENPYKFDHAITFPNRGAAFVFIMEMFRNQKDINLVVREIDGTDKFIHVTDLIKQGYGNYIGNMADSLWEKAEKVFH